MMPPRHGYAVVKMLDDELVQLTHPDYGSQVWSLIRIRRTRSRTTGRTCCICDNPVPPGTQAYAPITNRNNRGHRRHPACKDRLCAALRPEWVPVCLTEE